MRPSVLIQTSKEVIRHFLHRLGMRRPLPHLEPEARTDRFSKIYEQGFWKHGDEEVPSSGHGSSLRATAALRDALPALLDELGAEVMLDVGCGDLTWMQATQIRQQYIGVDIVPAVIEANRLHFASERRRWELCDAVEAELPDADVVFCREMLFHLGFADAMAVLRNVLAKPRRWLILTTDSSTLFNSDIQSGDYRPLNLERAPFRLPPPQRLISDDLVAAGRRLGVWRAADVASDLGIDSLSA